MKKNTTHATHLSIKHPNKIVHGPTLKKIEAFQKANAHLWASAQSGAMVGGLMGLGISKKLGKGALVYPAVGAAFGAGEELAKNKIRINLHITKGIVQKVMRARRIIAEELSREALTKNNQKLLKFLKGYKYVIVYPDGSIKRTNWKITERQDHLIKIAVRDIMKGVPVRNRLERPSKKQ